MNKKELVINCIGDTHFTPNTPSSRKDDYPASIEAKYRSIFDLYPCDIAVLMGDVFHRPLLPLKYVNKMARVEVETKGVDKHTTWVIPGNHDCTYSDVEYLNYSALGNWIETQLVEVLEDKIVKVGDVDVQLLGWIFGKSLPVARKDTFSILVGHAFYETSPIEGKDLVLTKDEIIEGGYNIVVLGHDHAKYEPVILETGQKIYRPGSLSRGTSHFYNVWREVSILHMKIVGKGNKIDCKAEYVVIPSKPPEECFLEEAREGKMRKLVKEVQSLVRSRKSVV